MTESASIKRLRLSRFKLDTLLNITKAINENLPAEELLRRAEDVLMKDLNIGKIVIIMYDEKWESILEAGCPPGCSKGISVEETLLPIKEITYVSSSENKSLEEFDVILPIYNNNSPLAFVLIGDIDEEEKGVSPIIKHIHFIQTLSNIVIVAIENIRLFDKSLRQEAVKKELELASKMQSLLIPSNDKLPNNEKIFITGFYRPHHEVGGDYYDCIQLDKQEYGFCIADVSGKGISAALLMANFQATLRALFSSEISLEDLVRKLNKSVLESAHGEKFITLFIAKYNVETRILSYVNAAHNAPLLYEINSKKLMKLQSNCLGIGMLDDIPVIEVVSMNISVESKIICYTDGLSELPDDFGREMGTKAVEKNLKNNHSIDVNIRDLIFEEQILEDNEKLFDDVSLLGIQIYK